VAAAAAVEGATTRWSPERTRAMPHIADFRDPLVSGQGSEAIARSGAVYNHAVALKFKPRLEKIQVNI
jgi:hypothetical protein